MPTPQEVLDGYAEGTPYAELAEAYHTFDHPTGDAPLGLLVEAAASTTGQRYASGVRPTVERFETSFLADDSLTSFADLAALDIEDETLVEVIGAERKRHVLLEAAQVLADRPEADDFDALQGWASEADVYRYQRDPIGKISGIGPSSFQYLRQLAGIDTAKPDPSLEQLVDAIRTEAVVALLDTNEPLRTLASAEWLSLTTEYRLLEIDRLAWWTYTDSDERDAVMELFELTTTS